MSEIAERGGDVCTRCGYPVETVSALSQGTRPHRMTWTRHKLVNGLRVHPACPLPAVGVPVKEDQ